MANIDRGSGFPRGFGSACESGKSVLLCFTDGYGIHLAGDLFPGSPVQGPFRVALLEHPRGFIHGRVWTDADGPGAVSILVVGLRVYPALRHAAGAHAPKAWRFASCVDKHCYNLLNEKRLSLVNKF